MSRALQLPGGMTEEMEMMGERGLADEALYLVLHVVVADGLVAERARSITTAAAPAAGRNAPWKATILNPLSCEAPQLVFKRC